MAADNFTALEKCHNAITLPPVFAESLSKDGKHPVKHRCGNISHPDLVC